MTDRQYYELVLRRAARMFRRNVGIEYVLDYLCTEHGFTSDQLHRLTYKDIASILDWVKRGPVAKRGIKHRPKRDAMLEWRIRMHADRVKQGLPIVPLKSSVYPPGRCSECAEINCDCSYSPVGLHSIGVPRCRLGRRGRWASQAEYHGWGLTYPNRR